MRTQITKVITVVALLMCAVSVGCYKQQAPSQTTVLDPAFDPKDAKAQADTCQATPPETLCATQAFIEEYDNLKQLNAKIAKLDHDPVVIEHKAAQDQYDGMMRRLKGELPRGYDYNEKKTTFFVMNVPSTIPLPQEKDKQQQSPPPQAKKK